MTEQEFKEYDAGGTWHQRYTITKFGCILNIAGLITGCGLAQIYGISNIDPNVTKEDFLKELEPLKKDGAGGLIATLGKSYYIHEDKLLKLGFELLSEYNNYRHSSTGSYKQKLYLLKL